MFLKKAKKLNINLDAADRWGQTGFISACFHKQKIVAEMLVKNSEKIQMNLDAKDVVSECFENGEQRPKNNSGFDYLAKNVIILLS